MLERRGQGLLVEPPTYHAKGHARVKDFSSTRGVIVLVRISAASFLLDTFAFPSQLVTNLISGMGNFSRNGAILDAAGKAKDRR